MPQFKRWTEDEIAFVQTNLAKLTNKQIAGELGRTPEAVQKYICKHKLSNYHRNLRYLENEKLYKNNRILGYICGLIASDGYISPKPYQRICLYLHHSDIKTVEFVLSNIINGNYRINKSANNVGFSITTPILIQYLANMGILTKKSYTIDVNLEDKSELFRLYFLRGVFDGDGTAFIDNEKPYNSQISISSASPKFLKTLQHYFDGTIHKSNTSACSILKWSSYNARKIARLLPNDHYMIARKNDRISNISKLQFNQENKVHGVVKFKNKFFARIQKDKKSYNLGSSYDIDDAKRLYDRKAFEFFGEKAKLNFPNEYFN